MPAKLSVSLLLTALTALASYAVLATLGPDWTRFLPATCLATHCFCEVPRAGELILQPANSWSSFAFVAVGFWIAHEAGHRSARAPLRRACGDLVRPHCRRDRCRQLPAPRDTDFMGPVLGRRRHVPVQRFHADLGHPPLAHAGRRARRATLPCSLRGPHRLACRCPGNPALAVRRGAGRRHRRRADLCPAAPPRYRAALVSSTASRFRLPPSRSGSPISRALGAMDQASSRAMPCGISSTRRQSGRPTAITSQRTGALVTVQGRLRLQALAASLASGDEKTLRPKKTAGLAASG